MENSPIWLIANWKMNGDAARARAWAFAVNASLAAHDTQVEVVFCPPVTLLAAARGALPANAGLRLGAQNCHAEAKGAFTGEISAAMLKEAGCSHVIIGHSERRAMGESDADVLAKAQAALASGLTPIICVGESRAEYDKKQTNTTLDIQLKGLKKLPSDAYLIAYEPVWAIGTSKTPEMAEISAAHGHIKSVLGSTTPVLYGGSVSGSNIGQILGIAQVSGVLIGGASLEIESMQAMLEAAVNVKK